MHIAKIKNISWLMIFVLFITWSSIPQDLAFAATTNKLSKEELEQAAQKLERLFDALEEAAKEIPRDTFDPKAIVEKVGKNPEKLFEWVRDNTYLVPYRGSLRGPIGVLMDRMGNSLDRSLLLHELLTIAGHKARLARGRLSAAQAKRVLNESRPVPPGGALAAGEESSESMGELINKYAGKYGLDPDELQSTARIMTMQQQHMAEEVAQRVEDQTKAILELVGEPEIDIRAAERAKAIETLRDHWWVQWKGSSGWIELDSTLPEAKAGEILVEVEATQQANDIDEALQHRVTIRVVIERWEDGKLEEEPVLEHALRPSKLFGKRIALRHVPLNWPEDFDLFAEGKPLERLKKLVLEEKEWLPVLTVGSEQIAQSSFTHLGEVKDEPGERLASPAEEFSSGAGGVIGGMTGALSGGEREDKEKKEPRLTAEWIEYGIHVPGEQLRTIRRQVFDLVGPASRAMIQSAKSTLSEVPHFKHGQTLLKEIEVLLQASGFSSEYILHLLVNSFLSDQELLLTLLRDGDLQRRKGLAEHIRMVMPPPGPEYGLAFLRWRSSRLRSGIFLDRPNVLSHWKSLKWSSDNELKASYWMDIVDNRVAVQSHLEESLFKLRLNQGVLDTNIEALLMKDLSKTPENTAELFTIGRVRDVKWVTLQGPDALDGQDLQIPIDIQARINQDLAEGYVVLAPRRMLSIENRQMYAWWRLDPTSGSILGIGASGMGAAFSEKVILDIGLATFIISYFYCSYARCWQDGYEDWFPVEEVFWCLVECMFLGGLVSMTVMFILLAWPPVDLKGRLGLIAFLIGLIRGLDALDGDKDIPWPV
jgi:hypothetical protein